MSDRSKGMSLNSADAALRPWWRRALPLLLLAGMFALCLGVGSAFGQTAVETVPIGEVTAEKVVRALAILVLFVVIAVLIATRKVPAMIALPLMALGIGLAAGLPLTGDQGISALIFEGKKSPPSGIFLLEDAIIYTLLGGMFARFISEARIAERLIKYAAEFGGENPFLITLATCAVTVLVFTAIGGLPAIIMLGTVIFPVLLSLGVPATICGSILLLTFPIGFALSPVTWATRASMYDLMDPDSFSMVARYFLIWAGLQVTVLMVFLSVEFLRMKRLSVSTGSVARSVVAVIAVATVLAFVGYFELIAAQQGVGDHPVVVQLVALRAMLFTVFKYVCGAALVIGMIYCQYAWWAHRRSTAQWNLLTPVVPLILILVLGFKLESGLALIAPAMLASLAYGYFTTPRDRGMQFLGKSIMNGVADVAAPAVLMMGIGMLITAARHPNTEAILTPILSGVIPSEPLPYVIFFFLASPLALYRGPLNEWGLGIGVARILKNFMPELATMGAIQSVSMLQDPTTTQNVWICSYLKLDINALLFKLFFYSLSLVLLGLILSAYLFF